MRKLLFVVAQFFFLSTICAEVAVIVHQDNTNSSISKNEVARIYLGKLKSFPNGSDAIPIDLNSGDAKKEFYAKVVRKSDAQLRAYWSRIIFTGKGQPPRQESSEDSVLNLISTNPNLVGYVQASKVTDNVKVILTI
jgi:ABC-type phosphate transport system substrate-binding protein